MRERASQAESGGRVPPCETYKLVGLNISVLSKSLYFVYTRHRAMYKKYGELKKPEMNPPNLVSIPFLIRPSYGLSESKTH